MCGFSGRILPNDLGSVHSLALGLPWLAQRGPDSQREWISKNGRVHLLHARLAIVDKTESAHQPLSSPNGKVTIAFVGEVYNHRELRRTLTDYRFETQSDTEVLLALYTRFGVAGFSQVKGMAVCAVVDEDKGRVALFRDAVGKKPLFYARWAGQLVFGTSLIPLIAPAGGAVEVRESAGAEYWRNSLVDPTGSVFSGAEPVLPGHALTFDFDGELVASERISPSSLEAIENESDARAHLSDLLHQAVRRRLEDNPSPCLMLSGGIDSTVLAVVFAAEAAALGLKPQAVTLGSVVPFMNDEPYARYAARRIGLPLTRVKAAPIFANSSRLADDIFAAIARQDEPLGMLSYFSRFKLIEQVRSVSRIVLTGDGGDEVFLGYSQTSRWVKAPNEVVPNDSIVTGPTLPSWMSSWGRSQNSVSLVGHNFSVLDRASAEQGVEARCPLLDWDVMNFARNLPPEILLYGQKSKGLLADFLRDWPAWFLERRKIGFALNLRWAWALSRFAGMRESISKSTQARFDVLLPAPLRRSADAWSTQDIFRNFDSAWKLMVWSAFEQRLSAAQRASESHGAAIRVG